MQVVTKSKDLNFVLENAKCSKRLSFYSDVALDREVEGDLLVGDMGQGLPFRPGTFDGCIRFEGQCT